MYYVNLRVIVETEPEESYHTFNAHCETLGKSSCSSLGCLGEHPKRVTALTVGG
jgi:hypothetical protein